MNESWFGQLYFSTLHPFAASFMLPRRSSPSPIATRSTRWSHIPNAAIMSSLYGVAPTKCASAGGSCRPNLPVTTTGSSCAPPWNEPTMSVGAIASVPPSGSSRNSAPARSLPSSLQP